MNLFEFEQFEMTDSQTENTVGGRGRKRRRRKGKGGGGMCEEVVPPVIDEEVEIEDPIFDIVTEVDSDYQLLEDGQVPAPIIIAD